MDNKQIAQEAATHIPRFPNESLFVTFYSFKGGVGRSCALANCAMALAAAGRKVLAIDFDLEGPGLCRLLNRGKRSKGLIEFLTEFREIIRKSEFPQLELSETQDGSLSINDYVSSIQISSELKNTKPGGQLDLLCAGLQDDSYPKRIEDLNIKKLYDDGIGSAIFQAFKEHIKKQGYHYILIDARTGFSDTGLISIFSLADAFVFLCGLNEQNILGTKFVIDDLNKDNRPYILVASPVPEAEEKLKSERFSVFMKELGRNPDVSIQYHPHLSLSEDLFIVEFPDSSIAAGYKRLVTKIRMFAGDTSSRFINEAIHKSNQKDYEEALSLLKIAGSINSRNTVRFMESILSDVKRSGIEDFADKYFDLAIELSNSQNDEIFHYRSHLWNDRSVYETVIAKKYQFIEKAINDIDKAISINAKDPAHFYCYATYLNRIGNLSKKHEYFDKAAELLNRALKIDNTNVKVYNAYGVALVESGKMQKEITLIKMAELQFNQAISINRDAPNLYNNLGLTIYYLYYFSKVKDAALLVQAKNTILKAESLKEGEGSYGMACLHAMEGHNKEALKWLKKALDKSPALREHAKYYYDFKGLRNDPEFKRLMSGNLNKKTKATNGTTRNKNNAPKGY